MSIKATIALPWPNTRTVLGGLGWGETGFCSPGDSCAHLMMPTAASQLLADCCTVQCILSSIYPLLSSRMEPRAWDRLGSALSRAPRQCHTSLPGDHPQQEVPLAIRRGFSALPDFFPAGKRERESSSLGQGELGRLCREPRGMKNFLHRKERLHRFSAGLCSSSWRFFLFPLASLLSLWPKFPSSGTFRPLDDLLYLRACQVSQKGTKVSVETRESKSGLRVFLSLSITLKDINPLIFSQTHPFSLTHCLEGLHILSWLVILQWVRRI